MNRFGSIQYFLLFFIASQFSVVVDFYTANFLILVDNELTDHKFHYTKQFDYAQETVHK